jgi:hypothetical protein
MTGILAAAKPAKGKKHPGGTFPVTVTVTSAGLSGTFPVTLVVK